MPACDCGGSPGGGGVDGGPDASLVDAAPVECAVPSDCDDAFGAPPCGAWECNAGACDVACPGCTDADHDGYGVEASPGDCAGADCDDADDQVFDAFVRSCYTGTGNPGDGVCRAGTETCVAGVVGQCTGEIGPTGEACNNEDDDCDLSTDESLGQFTCGIGACAASSAACTGGVIGTCVPGTPQTAVDDCSNMGVDDDCDGAKDEDCTTCVRVAPNGDDTLAVSTNNVTPFLTIQAAITWAAADVSRPRNVCVAQGAACGATATYAGGITMSDGISVLGQYQSTTYGRCTTGTTIIATGTATGVVFPATVLNPTALDGFRIDRALQATTAAVSVDGAQNVILSNLVINNNVAVTNLYGVTLANGADVQVLRSLIESPSGTNESIAVRSIGSKVVLRDNCTTLNGSTGRCTSACGATRGIRSRFNLGTGKAYGVYLEDSPNSVVETSGVCGGAGDDGAGIRIAGDGTGIRIRASAIQNFDSLNNGTGVWMEDCGGAQPWLVDNELIRANGNNGNTVVDAVRAVGDCHPVIDTNVLIAGGGEGQSANTTGVRCAQPIGGGVASRCAVIGNHIQGSSFGFPPSATGVRCDDDGCERIEGNFIEGRGGVSSYGVWLGSSGTVVANNTITGGCSTQNAIGVHAVDSFARLENNSVGGGACNGSNGALISLALDVVAAPGGNELDVHSNLFDGLGIPAGNACTSAGLAMSSTATTGVGIYRNNIFRAGSCPTRYDVGENGDNADPRIFESCDLDPAGGPTALYLDAPTNPLTTDVEVNALTDMTVSGVISADPLFVSYPNDIHLGAGSPCDNTGTPTGAPLVDMDGETRSLTTPDIGPDEN